MPGMPATRCRNDVKRSQVVDESGLRARASRITKSEVCPFRSIRSHPLAREGQLPFTYVAENNGNSIALLTGLGFVSDRTVQWIELK